jgi:phosphoadenosine phosphosulfate reductase
MQIELFDTFTPMVNRAVERVIDAYKFSQSLGLGKLYVAFSGGKDSICLHKVVELASEKEDIPFLDYAEVHYNVTGIDPPELVQFIKEQYPHVSRDMYKKSMWQLIVERGMPPTRKVRYCCTELKERGGRGRFTLTGVRKAESYARSQRGAFESIGETRKEGKILFNDNDDDRRMMEHCLPKNQYVCNPIIDWSDEDVWEFIRRFNMPYCSLYDQGYKRLGCIGCPMAGGKRQQEQFAKYPKFRDAYIRAFDRMLIHRKERGLETTWQTGQEVYDWWVGNAKTESPIEGKENCFDVQSDADSEE